MRPVAKARGKRVTMSMSCFPCTEDAYNYLSRCLAATARVGVLKGYLVAQNGFDGLAMASGSKSKGWKWYGYGCFKVRLRKSKALVKH